MLSSDLLEKKNQPSDAENIPRLDFCTELVNRLRAGFVYFNASSNPHIKRVSITHGNGEYHCIAQSRNGGCLKVLRDKLEYIADDGLAQLQANVSAVGGQCTLTQDSLNIDVPVGYQIMLTIGDSKRHKVHIAPVAD